MSGSTATGKTWLVCARVNPLFEQMRLAHLNGTISKLKRLLTKPHLLILDDFGIDRIDEQSKEDLFELLEARTDVGLL